LRDSSSAPQLIFFCGSTIEPPFDVLFAHSCQSKILFLILVLVTGFIVERVFFRARMWPVTFPSPVFDRSVPRSQLFVFSRFLFLLSPAPFSMFGLNMVLSLPSDLPFAPLRQLDDMSPRRVSSPQLMKLFPPEFFPLWSTTPSCLRTPCAVAPKVLQLHPEYQLVYPFSRAFREPYTCRRSEILEPLTGAPERYCFMRCPRRGGYLLSFSFCLFPSLPCSISGLLSREGDGTKCSFPPAWIPVYLSRTGFFSPPSSSPPSAGARFPRPLPLRCVMRRWQKSGSFLPPPHAVSHMEVSTITHYISASFLGLIGSRFSRMSPSRSNWGEPIFKLSPPYILASSPPAPASLFNCIAVWVSLQ